MIETNVKISAHELCEAHQINEEIIIEVVEYGIAQPLMGQSTQDWVFDPTSVHWLKKAVRLNQELEIDWVAVAMVIDLLKRNERLQLENKKIKHHLARFLLD